jgi:AraC-like DNA-binding protein
MGYEKDIMALISGLESHWNVKLDEHNQEVAKEYFSLLTKEFELGPEDRNPWILAAIAKAYILHIARIHNNNAQFRRKPVQYQSLYREYLDKLEEHHAETHYVSDYVEMLNVNEKQLNRACKAMTGHSARHIIDERLNFEAKRFLYYSTHTIKEISYYLGYKDPAHFVKFFKRKNGKTPGEYRNHLSSIEPLPPKKKAEV